MSIESQPITSQDKNTKCQDLKRTKRTNRPDKPCSHWLFTDARLNIVEVGRSRRDLIQLCHSRHHHVDDTRNQTLREQRTNLDIRRGQAPLTFVCSSVYFLNCLANNLVPGTLFFSPFIVHLPPRPRRRPLPRHVCSKVLPELHDHSGLLLLLPNLQLLRRALAAPRPDLAWPPPPPLGPLIA